MKMRLPLNSHKSIQRFYLVILTFLTFVLFISLYYHDKVMGTASLVVECWAYLCVYGVSCLLLYAFYRLSILCYEIERDSLEAEAMMRRYDDLSHGEYPTVAYNKDIKLERKPVSIKESDSN